jgi:hypothetical protein
MTPTEPDKMRRKVAPPEPAKVKPKAVIRVVMALASPEPAVVFKDRPEKGDHFDGFSTFDIWLAGLSEETFTQIQDGDLDSSRVNPSTPTIHRLLVPMQNKRECSPIFSLPALSLVFYLGQSRPKQPPPRGSARPPF